MKIIKNDTGRYGINNIKDEKQAKDRQGIAAYSKLWGVIAACFGFAVKCKDESGATVYLIKASALKYLKRQGREVSKGAKNEKILQVLETLSATGSLPSDPKPLETLSSTGSFTSSPKPAENQQPPQVSNKPEKELKDMSKGEMRSLAERLTDEEVLKIHPFSFMWIKDDEKREAFKLFYPMQGDNPRGLRLLNRWDNNSLLTCSSLFSEEHWSALGSTELFACVFATRNPQTLELILKARFKGIKEKERFEQLPERVQNHFKTYLPARFPEVEEAPVKPSLPPREEVKPEEPPISVTALPLKEEPPAPLLAPNPPQVNVSQVAPPLTVEEINKKKIQDRLGKLGLQYEASRVFVKDYLDPAVKGPLTKEEVAAIDFKKVPKDQRLMIIRDIVDPSNPRFQAVKQLSSEQLNVILPCLNQDSPLALATMLEKEEFDEKVFGIDYSKLPYKNKFVEALFNIHFETGERRFKAAGEELLKQIVPLVKNDFGFNAWFDLNEGKFEGTAFGKMMNEK